MSIQFPSAWDQLQFREMRLSLIETLKEIIASDKDLDVDYAIHLLFDDSDMATSPESYIGLVFFDDEEAKRIGELGVILGLLIDALGDARSNIYVNNPKWKVVKEKAAEAYNILKAKGEVLWKS